MEENSKNKEVFKKMWILLFISLLAYIAIILLSAFIFGEGVIFGIIVAVLTIVFVIIAFICAKIEVDTGYYECQHCNHKFVPKYKTVVCSMHIFTTRYLKCPECGKRSWAKKVLTKD